MKVGSPGGETPVNPASAAASSRYGRSMRTRDDIWMQDGDAWGVDLLAWEEDDDEPDFGESSAIASTRVARMN